MHLIIPLPHRHRRSLLGRFTVQPKRGAYTGRLAFDPDSLFHTDKQGRRLVTVDEGKSWRYAKLGATSHNARYQTGVAHVVTPTTAEAFEAGDPAHAHHEMIGPGPSHPDVIAPVQTSHTDAFKEAA